MMPIQPGQTLSHYRLVEKIGEGGMGVDALVDAKVFSRLSHLVPAMILYLSGDWADQRWAQYEAIQADIFDHLLAVLPLFDLRAFQNATGADLRSLQLGA